MQSELGSLIELELSERKIVSPVSEPDKDILAYVLMTCIEKRDLSTISVSPEEVVQHLRGRYAEKTITDAIRRLQGYGFLYQLFETQKGNGLRIYLGDPIRRLGCRYLDKHPEIVCIKR